MNRPIALILATIVVVASGCVIERKAECIAADACDRALAESFGDFDAADPTFGDAGTCWQTEDTAKPCVATCEQFRADQRLLALEQAETAVGVNKEVPLAVFEACGGDLASEAAAAAAE
jgi:hypothetical protein